MNKEILRNICLDKVNQARRKMEAKDMNYMELAKVAATGSTCLRRKVGAVIVKDGKAVSYGYNGAPVGCSLCETTGCIRQKMNVPSGERHELCRAIHAEQKALIKATESVKGAELYCTTFPCVICAKLLIEAGISKIYYEEGYADNLSDQMLAESSVKVVRYTY